MKEIEITSEVTGNVWKVLLEVGARVEADEPIILVESMKMEIPVVSEQSGAITAILVSEGDPVSEGDVVVRLSV